MPGRRILRLVAPVTGCAVNRAEKKLPKRILSDCMSVGH